MYLILQVASSAPGKRVVRKNLMTCLSGEEGKGRGSSCALSCKAR